MRLLPVAVLLLVALSGCGDRDGDAPTAAVDPTAPPSGSGISGVVVTTTIQPIPGATVELLETGDRATTDLFGRFRFDVGPGTYRLLASAPEHSTVEETAVVQDNETARIRIRLESQALAVPFHQTFQFDGRVDASLGPADDPAEGAKQALGADGCECVFQFPVGRSTVAVTVEALWEDSASPPDAAPTQYRYNVTSGTGDAWAAGAGPSPLVAHLGEDAFTEDFVFSDHAVLDVSLLPDAVWPTVDQTYTLFVTAWEVEGPPEGWSYVGGDR